MEVLSERNGAKCNNQQQPTKIEKVFFEAIVDRARRIGRSTGLELLESRYLRKRPDLQMQD